MISVCPFQLFQPLTNPSGIVPSSPITIGITVPFTSYSCFFVLWQDPSTCLSFHFLWFAIFILVFSLSCFFFSLLYYSLWVFHVSVGITVPFTSYSFFFVLWQDPSTCLSFHFLWFAIFILVFLYFAFFFIIILLIVSFSRECYLVIFHGSPSDRTFPQAPRTILSILIGFSNAVVWILLILLLLLTLLSISYNTSPMTSGEGR